MAATVTTNPLRRGCLLGPREIETASSHYSTGIPFALIIASILSTSSSSNSLFPFPTSACHSACHFPKYAIAEFWTFRTVGSTLEFARRSLQCQPSPTMIGCSAVDCRLWKSEETVASRHGSRWPFAKNRRVALMSHPLKSRFTEESSGLA